ncbi:hypothetical protein PSN45_005167 [Yamadazyma tenuis]|uniref:Uncharacterized protein n=1 Tax=Candida tenuis (strain ATCC 10573 / BCRC 21748 / CBS 615 / JCM 9827 / NBRC 10315 / NRRL Y-1498 / VKM Y-70) TaxID=590646 RepID=G3B0W1_CANTC|nr:uncharacterized protein CANTEDRAFT_113588 [Yamadazyma tenuis ATCC 10573]EGV64820.1 hypothetical protein CANTEDRAFT_113588 [Yamadazyma tenuis ATCC 10573]WEJ97611.1 hypothetical protein PSN45_005167 [Yamadazyma tenuis]
MPDDKANFAKNIAVSVAGSVGANKLADKAGLGQVGHIVSGVAGGIGANEAENKAEQEVKK